LYSFTEVLPIAFSPATKSFFKHITKGPAAEAIAFILFTRCITSSATYTIELTEQATDQRCSFFLSRRKLQNKPSVFEFPTGV
jgi:hypothetical protein